MRVPPDQSATFAEQAASASSGSRWRMARVTFVSRVPNKNVVTRLRASVTACRKCKKQPGVLAHRSGNIEKRHDRRFFHARTEIFQIDNRATRLHAGAQRAANIDEWPRRLRRKPPRANLIERQRQPRDGFLCGGNLRRGHLRKVFLLQHFAVGHRQPRVDFDFRFACSRSSRPENSAS